VCVNLTNCGPFKAFAFNTLPAPGGTFFISHLERLFGSRCSAITRNGLVTWLVFTLLMPRFKTWTIKPGQPCDRVRNALQRIYHSVRHLAPVAIAQCQPNGTTIQVLAKSQANGMVIVS
jgi:hypothetical protein